MINGNSAPNIDPVDNIMTHLSMMTEIIFRTRARRCHRIPCKCSSGKNNFRGIYRRFDMGDNIFRQQAKAATSEVTPSKLD